MIKTDIESIQVIFSLPEWTADEKFETEIPERYCGGHAYEGQIKGYRTENVITDGLFELNANGDKTEITETCLHSMGQYITVSFDCCLNDLNKYVELFQEKLRKFLESVQ